MIQKKSIIVLAYSFLWLIFLPTVKAQTTVAKTDDLEPEAVVLITNGDFFLAGETVYFSAFTFLGSVSQPSPLSKVLYIDLVNKEGDVVLAQKVALHQGRGSGDLFAGTDLPSGNYKLTAYTRWMLNFGENNFFQEEITFINPYRENPSKGKDKPGSTGRKRESEIRSASISLTLDRKDFGKREKVTLDLNARTAEAQRGSYTVSVKRVDSLEDSHHVQARSLEPVFRTAVRQDTLLAPELRGALVTGQWLSDNTAKPLVEETVAISLPEENINPKFGLTDSSGRVTWVLEDLPTRVNAFVDPVNGNGDASFKLFEDPRPDYSNLQFDEFYIDADLETQIEQRSVANQVENAYYQFKPDTLVTAPQRQPFYGDRGRTFVLDEYTRFKTVQETFVEIIYGAAVRIKNGKPEFTVVVPARTELNGTYSPMVIVDGMFLNDYEFLYDYPSQNIEKITIVDEEYFYGPQRFYGIIDIVTKDGDFKQEYLQQRGDAVTLKAIDAGKSYFYQSYAEDLKTSLAKIPDYRYQLFWDPAVTFNETARDKQVVFYSSDAVGTYEILVSGFTAAGEPVTSTLQFVVK